MAAKSIPEQSRFDIDDFRMLPYYRKCIAGRLGQSFMPASSGEMRSCELGQFHGFLSSSILSHLHLQSCFIRPLSDISRACTRKSKSKQTHCGMNAVQMYVRQHCGRTAIGTPHIGIRLRCTVWSCRSSAEGCSTSPTSSSLLPNKTTSQHGDARSILPLPYKYYFRKTSSLQQSRRPFHCTL